MMRVTLAVMALLLALTAAAFAADNEGDPARGADAFQKACARCHRNVAQVAPDLTIEQPETIYALDDFLVTHHTTDATMRADIIAYLLAR
jgi:mono/diheme cytochrome c family protein